MMNLYPFYIKMIKYNKWRIILFGVLFPAVSILMVVLLQLIQTSACAELTGSLTGTTRVILYQELRADNPFTGMADFFNKMAISVMGISSLGTLMLLRVPEDEGVKKRILAAPVTIRALSSVQIGAVLMQVPFVCLLHTAVAMGFLRGTLFCIQGLLMLFNVMMFSVSGIGLAFLIRRTTKDTIAMRAAMAGVVILMCFIGGGIVPDYYLGGTAKDIAVFTPVYWYVRANRLISEFQLPEISSLTEIVRCFSLQMVFAVTFYVVAYADQVRRRNAAK